MNNYEINFGEEDQDQVKVKGNFNKENFEANQRLLSTVEIKSALEAGTQLWDLAYIKDAYTEDNNTDDDEDEEEKSEDVKYVEEMKNETLDVMARMINERPKDGLLYFMNKEKSDLENKGTEESPLYHPISLSTLDKNECLESNQDPYSPYEDSRGEEDDSESEESDEEFDWFSPVEHTDDTYFNLVNKNRKTFMPGDQVFTCYGDRTNKSLLLNYGFCFSGNKYESCEFPLRLDIPVGNLKVSEMVDLEWSQDHRQSMRLKTDQICDVMVSYLRSVCKKSFFARLDAASLESSNRILLTRPVNLFFEQYVFTYYLQVCKYVMDQMSK